MSDLLVKQWFKLKLFKSQISSLQMTKNNQNFYNLFFIVANIQ